MSPTSFHQDRISDILAFLREELMLYIIHKYDFGTKKVFSDAFTLNELMEVFCITLSVVEHKSSFQTLMTFSGRGLYRFPLLLVKPPFLKPPEGETILHIRLMNLISVSLQQ
jgi:hypothetical protein